MKRNDIHAGKDYLVGSGSKDWMRLGSLSRVRVLNTEDRLVRARGVGYSRNEAVSVTVKGPDGEDVTLVGVRKAMGSFDTSSSVVGQYVNTLTGEPLPGHNPVLIETRTLKGPWADTKAEVERVREARRQREQAADDERSRNRTEVAALIARVNALGIKWTDTGYHSHIGRAQINKDALAALVALAEKGAQA